MRIFQTDLLLFSWSKSVGAWLSNGLWNRISSQSHSRLCSSKSFGAEWNRFSTQHDFSSKVKTREKFFRFVDNLKFFYSSTQSRQLTEEFSDLLKRDRSPVNVAANSNQHRSNSFGSHSIPLDPSVQRPLTTFSLVTHGFGSPALAAAVDVFQTYLTEMLKYYEKNSSMLIATTSTKIDSLD